MLSAVTRFDNIPTSDVGKLFREMPWTLKTKVSPLALTLF